MPHATNRSLLPGPDPWDRAEDMPRRIALDTVPLLISIA